MESAGSKWETRGTIFFLPKYEFPIFIKLEPTTPYMSQNVVCVAGGSGCPRELRSQTRVQKAAQVARKMGRSPGNFACGKGLCRSQKFLTGFFREGISSFTAKSFARAPTPASYAGYAKYDERNLCRSNHKLPNTGETIKYFFEKKKTHKISYYPSVPFYSQTKSKDYKKQYLALQTLE